MECDCQNCKGACEEKPGWFAPGEAEKAAELLRMPLKQFFDEKLGVDFWAATDESDVTYVLAPAVKYGETGEEYSFNPRGECVFYENGKCNIHAAKPRECALWDHTMENEAGLENKETIRDEWKENQGQITELLGRKPILPVPTIDTVMGLMAPSENASKEFRDLHKKLEGLIETFGLEQNRFD